MIFVDTSVFVAIVGKEDDARFWLDHLEVVETRFTSPLVLLEATMRLSTILTLNPLSVGETLTSLTREIRIEVDPITADDYAVAVDAFVRYGKGRGHPARLNLADCLSYACAKRRGLKLLYKGDDFAKTDMA